VSNLSWAFATLSFYNVPLLESIAAESMRRISDFSAQELANTAWSCAVLGFWDEPLQDALANSSIARIQQFDAQGHANTAWALDLLGGREATYGFLRPAHQRFLGCLG